ncbi:MAG: hypothetical protein DLM73_06390 [Chthoniobacterales bacterium]|nr:MAG: hypothetical protein DLM73_06390 [Chthoniobacterales bacterium]
MKTRHCLASAVVIGFLSIVSLGHTQDGEEKHHKHHKLWDLLNAASPEEHAKFRAAKKQAMLDPAVQAAYERRKKADVEYRDLLDKEMLKVDPSLKPLLDRVNDLKKRDDF